MQQYILDEAADFAWGQLRAVGKRARDRAQREAANWAVDQAIKQGKNIHQYILDKYPKPLPAKNMPRRRMFSLYYGKPGYGRHYPTRRPGFPRTRNIVSNSKSALQKYYDKEVNFTQCYENEPCLISNLHPIAVGNDSQERVGREVYIKSMHVRGTVSSKPSTTEPARVRLVFFIDTQYNGTGLGSDLTGGGTGLTAWNTIFNQDLGDGTSVIGDEVVMQFRDLDRGGRFRILYDRTFQMVGHGTDVIDKKFVTINKKFKKPLKITFDGTAGTNPQDNAVGCIMITDQNSVTTANHDANFLIRFRYQD